MGDAVAHARRRAQFVHPIGREHAVSRQHFERCPMRIGNPPSLVGDDVVSDVDGLLQRDHERERERVAQHEVVRQHVARCRTAGACQGDLRFQPLQFVEDEPCIGHGMDSGAALARHTR